MGQLRLLICAIQFLTRLPTPALRGFQPDMISRSARYFPLVGALVGAICGLTLIGADRLWSGVLPALLAVAIGVLVTGAFHEDGLADACDGLGGGGDPARRLAIMKDSRIGTYGALGLGLTLALKVAGLSSLPAVPAALTLVAAHAGGRAASVCAMRGLAYVGDLDLAKWKPAPVNLSAWEVAIALALGLAPLVLLPPVGAAWGLGLGAALALGLALTAKRLLGGYVGDVLGAVEQVFELGFVLGIAAWARI
ncbi:adenosylcobinamide-GDP ribazoletransferase [Phenylobacterium aquaticum]|uniref:adenosylcobinamide-GDP ribazoletransferase n=1 Tax=Phenylobacterium aquaticum TaxID=1763816 RepID=UPI0026ED56BE|nr:adenosylcobinamide-GDP ribazoletransferase [Phenylobacterium aquaticum]